jgi:hypothetical protein
MHDPETSERREVEGKLTGTSRTKFAGNCRIESDWNLQNSSFLELAELKVTRICRTETN